MKTTSLHTRTMGRMACVLALTSIFAACEKSCSPRTPLLSDPEVYEPEGG
ncbi:MAG: hypothetical protein ACKOEZ_10150 [Spartobacteria bacterium]